VNNRISDTAAKAHMAFFARMKSFLMGRIQVARVKCIAERNMHITTPHTRPTRVEVV
jgi:hypothetical protein